MKKTLSFILILFAVLVFHNDVAAGVNAGLLLWYKTLVPALLPFIIITNALTETYSFEAIASLLENKLPNIYEIIAVIFGNLCGFPIGGKIINDFVELKYISSERANSLLSVSGQASPMFLLGVVYPMLSGASIPLYIFILLIYSPTIILFIFKSLTEYKCTHSPFINRSKSEAVIHKNFSSTSLHAVNIMVLIGIYVIIFSIFQSILNHYTDNLFSKCALSFLEITTGLNTINNIDLSRNMRICLIMCLTSFGGLCSAFQINGVLTYEAATIKKYLRDKIILSAGTFIMTYIYLMIRFSSPL